MRRAVLLGLMVAFAGACASPSTLSEQALQKQDETVKSAAAEGALLAADVARGRATEPFARIHSGKLAEQAKGAVDTVGATRAAPGLEAARRRVLRGARKVERALTELHEAPTDRALARHVRAELEQEAR